MSIEQATYERLSADPQVSALVSSRIYPGLAPTSATTPIAPRPYVTVDRITGQRRYTLAGADTLPMSNVQIDIWAVSTTQRHAIFEAMRDSICGNFRGNWGATIQLAVRACLFEPEIDSYVEPTEASEEPIFRRTINAKMFYREVVPSLA